MLTLVFVGAVFVLLFMAVGRQRRSQSWRGSDGSDAGAGDSSWMFTGGGSDSSSNCDSASGGDSGGGCDGGGGGDGGGGD